MGFNSGFKGLIESILAAVNINVTDGGVRKN